MVSKVVIPVAGRGTRLLPLTAAVPKALLPLVDAAGRVRCVLHWVLAEAASAGLRQAAIVVSPGQQEMLDRYIDAARRAGAADLPDDIHYIRQPEPRGFGDAVLRAAPFAEDDAAGFLLLLGDHVHQAAPGAPPCAAQVVEAFAKCGGAAMVGMQVVGPEQLARVGVAGGEPLEGGVYRCTDLIEKPDLATARQRLRTPGLPADHFLAHGGIYAFSPEIFDCLRRLRADEGRPAAETQLTDAQRTLLGRRPGDYHLLPLAGRAWDTGTPAGYAATFAALAAG